jgi:glycosyltransferase involved in cell wall biosynthesis
MDTKTLLKTIQARGVVLFGTGFVAEKIVHTLAEQGLQDCVRGFVVSKAVTTSFKGKPVWSVDQYSEFVTSQKDKKLPSELPLLCIAVHESLRATVEQSLSNAGLDFVWIYPNYLELAWGTSTPFVVDIPVQMILQRQEFDQAWISVRYAALKECLFGRQDGPASALYVKAASLFSKPETARQRLTYAVKITKSILKGGYDRSRPILVDNSCRIIDGLHRLAGSVLAGCQSVPCLVVEASDRFEEYFPEENRLTKAAQEKAGLTLEEKELLKKARQELLPVYTCSEPEITVILPVYNVADYMDQCLATVTEQTLRQIEILLIDDGSTDKSLEKCWEWTWKDTRITVFHRENDGVASARNFGVLMARGKYIAFVDPDDWLEKDYLEKLWKAAEATDADFAECDLWRYDNRSGKKIYRSCYGRMGQAYTLPEHMKYGPTATYKAISRKSLWTKYRLAMPKCSFESPAIYSLLLALSNRIVNVREALYYYRRFRENSLVENGYAHKDGKPNNRLAIKAMDFLVEEFRRTGRYEEFAGILESVVKYRLNDILAMQFHRKSPGDFRELTQNYRHFLAKRFPEGRNEPYITWGGYNLNRILTHMDWLHDPYARFNFSSLISLMNQEKPAYGQIHKNRYRQIMLERERTHSYWEILAELKPKFLFIDLIEERFDMLQLGNSFVTLSDAFEGAKFTRGFSVMNPSVQMEAGKLDGKEELTVECLTVEELSAKELSAEELISFGQVISRDSARCTDLWQQACQKMVKETQRICPDIRFVILENYLCETVGNLESRKPFANIEDIRKINSILRQYYSFLKEILPEAPVISPSKDDLYFTDEKYEYGAIPSHLNEIENQKIAKKIEEIL